MWALFPQIFGERRTKGLQKFKKLGLCKTVTKVQNFWGGGGGGVRGVLEETKYKLPDSNAMLDIVRTVMI